METDLVGALCLAGPAAAGFTIEQTRSAMQHGVDLIAVRRTPPAYRLLIETIARREPTRPGKSCGSVVSQWFDPSNLCGVSGQDNCAAEWIKVTGSQLACRGGDSGGPLYHNEVAYGTLQAGETSGNQKGQCEWASFMRMDHFIALPLLAN